MINNIDNNYASVLFTLGKNKKKLREYYEWSNELLVILEKNQGFCQLLANSSIEKSERKDIIKEIFEHDLDETFIYFLWTVVDFNRIRELSSIIKLFLKLCQQYYDIHYVQVTSAYALSKAELESLENALKKGMGLSQVTINNVVDPTVIGGIKLKTNAVSIDDTIRDKLNKMRESSFKLAQQGE